MAEMTWVAYDPGMDDRTKDREQFNGQHPAWGETKEEFEAKQGIPVPNVGDVLVLRMGYRTVESRRLEAPERDEHGKAVTGYYWTIIVR